MHTRSQILADGGMRLPGILSAALGTDGSGNVQAQTQTNTRYEQDFGDGSSTSFTITHNLGVQYVIPVIYNKSTGAWESCSVVCNSTTQCTLSSEAWVTTPPSAAAYHVVVVGGSATVAQTYPNMQNGVIGSGDLLLSSISINTSTAALTFTPATPSQNVYVTSAGGVLVATTYAGGSKTLTPGSLPTTGNYMVIAVEIDTAGTIFLHSGVQTATQVNSTELLYNNGPSTTSGRMRIGSIGIWNNAGVYNFSDHTTVASQNVNWMDDRKFALNSRSNLGFKVHSATSHVPGTSETQVPWSSPVQYDATNGWVDVSGANYRFHPHQAGYWLFTLTCVQSSGVAANAWYELRMRKNGSDMGDAAWRGQAGSTGGAMNFTGTLMSPADGNTDFYDVTDLMSAVGGISNQVWWTGTWQGF